MKGCCNVLIMLGSRTCKGVEDMDWPVAYDDKVKFKSVSVFGDDFDFMAVDLCGSLDDEASISTIYQLVARALMVVWALWKDGVRFFPDSPVP